MSLPIARRMLGGLEVSAIGLGAPIYAEPSASAVIPNLHRALDREVDLVDSSDPDRIFAMGAAAGPRYSAAAKRRVRL